MLPLQLLLDSLELVHSDVWDQPLLFNKWFHFYFIFVDVVFLILVGFNLSITNVMFMISCVLVNPTLKISLKKNKDLSLKWRGRIHKAVILRNLSLFIASPTKFPTLTSLNKMDWPSKITITLLVWLAHFHMPTSYWLEPFDTVIFF